MIHEYKTITLSYGNGFDETVNKHIEDHWAVFNIWCFDGPTNHGGLLNYATQQYKECRSSSHLSV